MQEVHRSPNNPDVWVIPGRDSIPFEEQSARVSQIKTNLADLKELRDKLLDRHKANKP